MRLLRTSALFLVMAYIHANHNYGGKHMDYATYIQESEEMLREGGFTDWEVEDDCVIVCPHGSSIEWDGECHKGCVSPFVTMGLV